MRRRFNVRAEWISFALCLFIGGSSCIAFGAHRAAALDPCHGDCDGDGAVTVDELLTMVNIALENAELTACAPGDIDGDGHIAVNEILAAVNAALDSCTPLATATPTATSPPTPTATFVNPPVTPGDLAISVAGRVALVADGVGIIPSVVTAIAAGLEFGNSPAAACPSGGSALRTCTTHTDQVTIEITLTDCGLDMRDGTAIFTGTVTLAGSGLCDPLLVTPPIAATVHLMGNFEQGDVVKQTINADVTGTVDSAALGGMCFLTAVDLTVSGSGGAQVPNGGGVAVQFTGTQVSVAITQFDTATCIPLRYTLTLNGAAALMETTEGNRFAAGFQDFTIMQDATVSPAQVQLNGAFEAACISRMVSIQTVTPIISRLDTPCFTGGAIMALSDFAIEEVVYGSDGAVGIDSNLDGTLDASFTSCLAPQLLMCSF